MGTYRALLVFLSLLAPALAQPAPDDHVKVEGAVVNSVTGKPVPRVLVQLNGRSLLTGAEGEFSFDGVSPGIAYITLTKPGFFGSGTSPHGASAQALVEVNADTGRIVLKLVPEAVIFGRVTGQDEEPLEGALIQVWTHTWVDGRHTLTRARGDASTDEDGNYRLASLPPGRYYLVVKAGNLARRILGAQTPKSAQAYPAIFYYPGTKDLAAAGTIEITAGQKEEGSFSLALAPAFQLAGKVVTSGAWKQVHAPALVDDMDQHLFSPEQFDATSGSFEFRAVPAGSYTINVSGSDPQDRYHVSHQRITIAKSVSDARFLLQPGAEVPVVTRLELEKPRPTGSCVWRQPDGQDQRSDCSDYPAAGVELIAVDSARTRFSSEYRPMTDPSAFAIHGVAPGRYMVRVRANIGGYVQSVHSGDLDLQREALTVPENGSVSPIEVVLRDDPGTLQVSVHGTKPARSAAILLLMEGELVPKLQMAGTTTSYVTFPPVPPGNYKVLAFDSLSGLDYANPEILVQYMPNAASVTVAANGNASVIVDLIRGRD
jgi:hypothetical protein